MNCPKCSRPMEPIKLWPYDARNPTREPDKDVSYAWTCRCGVTLVIPDRVCPFCAKVCDRQMQVALQGDDPSLPVPGALSVCLDCAELSVFDDALQLRALTNAELQNLLPEERAVVKTAQRAILSLRSRVN